MAMIRSIPGNRPPLPLAVALAVAAVTVVSGCGPLPEPAPPTPQPGATSATPPGAADEAAKPAPPPLGSLVDRMDRAWATVTSYRAHFTGGQGPDTATPSTSAPATIRIEQEIAGATRRRQVMTGAGANDHEAIIDGPSLYIRGAIADAIAPGTTRDTWIVMPASAISPESAAGHVLGGFLATPRSPLAGVGENLRPQGMRDLGPREVEGRSCRAWGVADTTEIGTRLDITIAVDGASLPCLLETRVGSEIVSAVTYDSWGAAIDLAVPAGAVAVTPVAGEDAGHD